jgi:hypothetical protein
MRIIADMAPRAILTNEPWIPDTARRMESNILLAFTE